MEIRNYLNCKEIFLSNKIMVLFDNVEIGNLDKANPFSAATLDYVDHYLEVNGIFVKNSKLGIKNSNPQDELDVSGSINSKSLKTNLLTVWNPNNTANQDAIINLNVAGSSSGNPFIGMNIYNESNAQWSLGIDNVDNLFKIKSNSDFSGTGKLVLNQNGFMGVGVEAPTAPIHLSNTISNKKILLYDVTGNQHQFTGLGIETDGALRYQVNQSGVDHIFYSGSTSSSSTELMRIKGTGKIGINESNPTTARLTVNTGNVDEFGLSLVTTSASGKGAGLEFDNKGTNGRNYGIYSGNNGSLNIYDKTTNLTLFETGITGAYIRVNTNITGNTNIVGNTNITGNNDITGNLTISGGKDSANVIINKNSGPTGDNAMLKIKNGSTATGGSLIYLNKKNNNDKENQWNIGVGNEGTFRIIQDIVDGSSNDANLKMLIDKVKSEIYGDLNVTGKIKEKGNDLLPVGTILPYAAASTPAGFLICDGSEYSRTGVYKDLYSVIQLSYGTPSNTNNFKIPDLRCSVPVGMGSVTGGGRTTKLLGNIGGAETHTLTQAEMPIHYHRSRTNVHRFDNGWDTNVRFVMSDTGGYDGRAAAGIDNAGGDQPHNNMQPYVVINYIIKY